MAVMAAHQRNPSAVAAAAPSAAHLQFSDRRRTLLPRSPGNFLSQLLICQRLSSTSNFVQVLRHLG